MRKGLDFKKRYLLLLALFPLTILVWILCSLGFPIGQEVCKQLKVNPLVNLYITQVNAGAMTSFSYHYYLYDAKKNEVDFINHVDELTPFMITNDNNAQVSVTEGKIYLNVRGDVYSFTNTTSLASVHLTAAPY